MLNSLLYASHADQLIVYHEMFLLRNDSIVKPSKKVYFLPFLLLRKVWVSNYENWLSKYARRFAPNKTYRTSNIPIPVDVLFKALHEAMGHKDK
jgi:hypothetical protein